MKKTLLCKLHPDLHLPAHVTVGTRFDGTAYARQAKKAGVDCLVHYAKDHYGHAYYPTKFGTVHPGLGFDMLNEFVRGCKDAGISPSIYYSVFLDTAAVRHHPDWVLQETPQLSPAVFSKKYLPICVNSGYLEEMLLPQTMELVAHYQTDELFFDTMSEFTPCYCPRCAEKFGHPIPTDKRDPLWHDYVNWYIRQYDGFFDRILQAVHDVRPDIDVVVNWRWSATLPATPVRHVKRLVGDLFVSPSLAGYFCRYWAGTGLPFDYMCGRFLHGLGDWSNSPVDALITVAASTAANGGGFYIIDRQLPDGTLEDRSYPLLHDVFSFLQARRSVLTDTVHVRETAVLHGLENIIGGDNQFFPDKESRDNRLRPLKAIAQLFLRSGKHYTALNTARLLETLSDYKLLILPEVDYLDDATLSAIQSFAENGGAVLIIQSDNTDFNPEYGAEHNPEYGAEHNPEYGAEYGPAPSCGGLLTLAGVSAYGQAQTPYSYIEQYTGATGAAKYSDPLLVRGRFTLVKPLPGTVMEAALIAPWCAGDGDAFGHGFAPPSTATPYAAITRRRVGDGTVCYVAGPVLTSYFTYNNPDIMACIARLYDRLLPRPIAKIAEEAHIELAVVRKHNDLILHLVNQSGKETVVAHYLPVTEYVPHLYNIRLFVHCAGYTEQITLEPESVTLKGTTSGDYCVVTIPHMHYMATCRVKDYFCDSGKSG